VLAFAIPSEKTELLKFPPSKLEIHISGTKTITTPATNIIGNTTIVKIKFFFCIRNNKTIIMKKIAGTQM
jgi:hypothetical protein